MIRSGETVLIRAAWVFMDWRVVGSMEKPRRAENWTARNIRSGSSSKARGKTCRKIFVRRSSWPHGVDREIPASQVLFHREVGIVFHLEIPVAHPGGPFGAGKGDVKFGMGPVGPKFDDAEGFSHRLHASMSGEEREKILKRNAGDQQVFVFLRKPEEEIAQGSPHLIDVSSPFFDRC
jgi:hypothetical protein